MLDFEQEVLDNTLSEIDHAIGKQSKRNEITIPLREKSGIDIDIHQSLRAYIV